MEAVKEPSWWDWAIPYVTEIGIINYMVPLIICAVVYLLRCVKDYRQDLENCENKFYSPTLTIGLIFWRIVLTITPAVNTLALVFDCAGSVFKYLGKTFDFPLVGHRYRPGNPEEYVKGEQNTKKTGSWREVP